VTRMTCSGATTGTNPRSGWLVPPSPEIAEVTNASALGVHEDNVGVSGDLLD
jgi:hypothetical protein